MALAKYNPITGKMFCVINPKFVLITDKFCNASGKGFPSISIQEYNSLPFPEFQFSLIEELSNTFFGESAKEIIENYYKRH